MKRKEIKMNERKKNTCERRRAENSHHTANNTKDKPKTIPSINELAQIHNKKIRIAQQNKLTKTNQKYSHTSITKFHNEFDYFS